MAPTSAADPLNALLRDRILVIDGAMATMLQGYGLDEAAYRGRRFVRHPVDLHGCHDLLCLTQPEVVQAVHRAYLEAGADLIETNTFNATPVSLADYDLQEHVGEINRAAARLAREVADEFTDRDPDQRRFVAGSIGPTRTTLSLSPDVEDPAHRSHTFDQVVAGYSAQIEGLVAGGVDLLLLETAFDTLTLKAGLCAAQEFNESRGVQIPLMVSATVADQSGRTLSGQTLEAFWYSVEHAGLLSVGLNCALGPAAMRPYLEELAALAPVAVSCYPNAGLPNEFGAYDESPEQMARVLGDFAARGWLNLVGGCCGTTPDHIRALRAAVTGSAPRVPAKETPWSRFSGLEPLVVRPDTNLVLVGERTNVTGSRRFARLIKAGDFESAVEIARQQVEGGANVVDVNMDEALLDSVAAVTSFLNRIAAEPDIARVPVMVDSSSFAVLEAGLKCLQGKAIVNSISLKEGEETFRRQARILRRHGAAVVVMAFDESGQATTVERRLEIYARAYRILTEEVGFPARDLVFDPNVLTVATGMEEHDEYARSFIESVRRLKELYPEVKLSGGVSNLSFSFRTNETVRRAMHSVFLYHAVQAGLDMAIVNAGQLDLYEEIPPDLRELVEDVVLCRRRDATERLLAYAAAAAPEAQSREREETWRRAPLDERLEYALLQGREEHLEADLREALEQCELPLQIIEGPLMAGMNRVGDLFGAGKMFLPQVVKSARVMKRAVSFLEPWMEEARAATGGAATRGRVLLATVKGDVHDIGKNIVAVVLRCNNYEVIDLGVMVPADRILAAARAHQVHLVGLSGLITPSLQEMVHVASELERDGFAVPLLIGGATTSRKHTALRIAPAYSHPTVHVPDASRAPAVVAGLLSPEQRPDLVARIRREQEHLQSEARAQPVAGDLLPYPEARGRRVAIAWQAGQVSVPEFLGVRHLGGFPLEQIAGYIDWTPLFHVWELRGGYPRILDDPVVGPQARRLLDDARALLDRILREEWLRAEAVYGFFPAAAVGDDIAVFRPDAPGQERLRLHTLRQQRRPGQARRPCHALADFVAPRDAGVPDHIGAFALTAGIGTDERVRRLEAAHDDYGAIMLKALADRLAEAFAELLHERVRREWGYGRDERLSLEDLVRERYRGIRPAPGYPACPDHTEKGLLFELLEAEARTGIRLTETYAMHPAASVCGLYLAHPEARYFAVGPLGRDQVEDYAGRKGIAVSEAERWLAPSLGYDPRPLPA